MRQRHPEVRRDIHCIRRQVPTEDPIILIEAKTEDSLGSEIQVQTSGDLDPKTA